METFDQNRFSLNLRERKHHIKWGEEVGLHLPGHMVDILNVTKWVLMIG